MIRTDQKQQKIKKSLPTTEKTSLTNNNIKKEDQQPTNEVH